MGPCTLIRCHWNFFDLSHMPVTVDAARVLENLWNDCKRSSFPCLYPAWVDAIVGVVADRIPRVCARAVISDRTKTTDADRRRLGRSPSSDSRHVWPTFVPGHYMCNGNGPAHRKGLVRSGAIQSFAWQPAVSRPDYGAIESLSAWDGFDNHRG